MTILAQSVELIGINEQVDQNKYCQPVAVQLDPTRNRTGEVLSVCLYSTEDGTGAVQRPSGRLLLLSADPANSLNAASLGAGAVWPTVVGTVDVDSSDWSLTDTGGAVVGRAVAIPYTWGQYLYAVWFHRSATSFNDAGGDDEQLELQIWFRHES